MGGLLALLPTLFGFVKVLLPFLDKIIPDKDLAAQLREKLQEHVLNNEAAAVDATRSVMESDQKSDSWYTRAARPTVTYWSLLMVTGICVEGYTEHTHYIVNAIKLVPAETWYFMAGSIGIYALGRSWEKSRK